MRFVSCMVLFCALVGCGGSAGTQTADLTTPKTDPSDPPDSSDPPDPAVDGGGSVDATVPEQDSAPVGNPDSSASDSDPEDSSVTDSNVADTNTPPDSDTPDSNTATKDADVPDSSGSTKDADVPDSSDPVDSCVPTVKSVACGSYSCGKVPDGCGNLINCGSFNGDCQSPQTCVGGQYGGICTCSAGWQATDCTGLNCGTYVDPVCGSYSCGSDNGSCPVPSGDQSSQVSCGGGVPGSQVPGVCGCTPLTQAQACAGLDCSGDGTVGDGCNDNVAFTCGAGECDGPQVCGTWGSGGTPHVCDGCTLLQSGPGVCVSGHTAHDQLWSCASSWVDSPNFGAGTNCVLSTEGQDSSSNYLVCCN